MNYKDKISQIFESRVMSLPDEALNSIPILKSKLEDLNSKIDQYRGKEIELMQLPDPFSNGSIRIFAAFQGCSVYMKIGLGWCPFYFL